MNNELNKRYGLMTAIAMVVGIVIGSGVFFKAGKILSITGGNLSLGILAWVIGGIIMVICAYVFSIMATRNEKVNGIVDYAEQMVSSKYGYFVGWILSSIYYPTLTSVLAWVSSMYLGHIVGYSPVSAEAIIFASFFLVVSFAINTLSPKLAGRFQVSTTIIKLIPLFAMAIIGTIMGLNSGMLVENFSHVVTEVESPSIALFGAVVATAFAFEGWIIAISINGEIKDAKKNLPKALIVGTFIVLGTYVLYYIGLSGSVLNEVLIEEGEAGSLLAFQNAFGTFGSAVLYFFVVISCLGTLNGLMLACARGFYINAHRNMGPKPKMFVQLDNVTNIPANSAILALLVSMVWLLFFYGSQLVEQPWFGAFSFDSSELPIITVYALYLPIFVNFIRKNKDLSVFKRFIMPILAIIGSLFMIIASIYSHGIDVLFYLIMFVVIVIVGAILNIVNEKKR